MDRTGDTFSRRSLAKAVLASSIASAVGPTEAMAQGERTSCLDQIEAFRSLDADWRGARDRTADLNELACTSPFVTAEELHGAEEASELIWEDRQAALASAYSGAPATLPEITALLDLILEEDGNDFEVGVKDALTSILQVLHKLADGRPLLGSER